LRGCIVRLVYIEDGLQLDDQLPLVGRHLFPVEVLEAVDACAGNEAVEGVLFFEVTPVARLVAPHLDLDGNRRLALLADRELLVLALNGCSDGSDGLVVSTLAVRSGRRGVKHLHSAERYYFLGARRRVRLHRGDRSVEPQLAFDDVHANNDRARLVEHSDRGEDTREYGQ
jgi:hypothetical protein